MEMMRGTAQMLKPCGHRVLVKAKSVETESKGGIILSASEREIKLEKAGICEGIVISLGPTAFRDFDKDYMPKWIRSIFDYISFRHFKSDTRADKTWAKWAKEGDRVYYSQYGGKYVIDPISQEEYVLMNDDDICCIIIEE